MMPRVLSCVCVCGAERAERGAEPTTRFPLKFCFNMVFVLGQETKGWFAPWITKPTVVETKHWL